MNACIDCVKVYRNEIANQKNNHAVLMAHHMRLLPLYILALMKNVSDRHDYDKLVILIWISIFCCIFIPIIESLTAVLNIGLCWFYNEFIWIRVGHNENQTSACFTIFLCFVLILVFIIFIFSKNLHTCLPSFPVYTKHLRQISVRYLKFDVKHFKKTFYLV